MSEAFSLDPWLWKGCHLWHNHTHICGLQHFASVWKGIFVSLRQLPQSPCFVNTWVAFSVSVTEIRLCRKHKNTHSIHRGGLAWGNERVSPPESKPNRVRVWQIVFLSAKGQTSKNVPMWGKMSPHLNTASLPSPSSVPATALPLNVFTLSSFDCPF